MLGIATRSGKCTAGLRPQTEPRRTRRGSLPSASTMFNLPMAVPSGQCLAASLPAGRSPPGETDLRAAARYTAHARFALSALPLPPIINFLASPCCPGPGLARQARTAPCAGIGPRLIASAAYFLHCFVCAWHASLLSILHCCLLRKARTVFHALNMLSFFSSARHRPEAQPAPNQSQLLLIRPSTCPAPALHSAPPASQHGRPRRRMANEELIASAPSLGRVHASTAHCYRHLRFRARPTG